MHFFVCSLIMLVTLHVYWGNKEWLAVHYGEFEEARGG